MISVFVFRVVNVTSNFPILTACFRLNAVIPQFVKRVDPSTKPSDEDVDLCFKGMRYIRINVSRSVYCFFCI